MRRALFLAVGVLEFIVAAVLVGFGWQLPGTAEVEGHFDKVHQVTKRTGHQVRLLRDQVHELRQPELQEMADRMQIQMHRVSKTLRSQNIDFETVKAMSEAMGGAADGLSNLADTLDTQSIGKLSEGLGTTADYLDQQVVPAAAKTADNLDASTASLKTDAERLAGLLRAAPLDLKAAREIHDGLARFSEGLDKVNSALKLEKFDTMREGVKGLETSLTTGAEQVERLSGYTYPVVTIQGIKPTVNQKQFWPEGDQIAEGMRKAAEGVAAAGKEMDGLAAELPHLRESLQESRKVAERSREALANALQQQDKVEPLLKDIPEHAARLADELPRLGTGLARILRDTEKLKEVAASMRQAQKGIDGALSHWPELRQTLTRSATALKATQQQLRYVVEHREDYEQAVNETAVLTEEFADRLPRFTHTLDSQLRDQEQSFDELGDSIDQVSEALPVYGQTASHLVMMTRLLLWLFAGIVGLHGLYLVLSARLGRQFSP